MPLVPQKQASKAYQTPRSGFCFLLCFLKLAIPTVSILLLVVMFVPKIRHRI